MSDKTVRDVKPAFRGYLHQGAFYAAIGAGAVLIAMAPTSQSRHAAIIYIASLVCLFGMSALYHRPMWNQKIRSWLKRFDHASIYFLIAGSATPILLVGVNNAAGFKLFLIMWIAAAIGALKCFFWPSAPRLLNAILYVMVGWLAIPFVSEINQAIGFSQMMILMTGGIIYSLGALVYAFRFPDPYPKIFGYHEVFHAMVIVASVLHFVVIYHLIQIA